jgi:hypothetical protein
VTIQKEGNHYSHKIDLLSLIGTEICTKMAKTEKPFHFEGIGPETRNILDKINLGPLEKNLKQPLTIETCGKHLFKITSPDKTSFVSLISQWIIFYDKLVDYQKVDYMTMYWQKVIDRPDADNRHLQFIAHLIGETILEKQCVALFSSKQPMSLSELEVVVAYYKERTTMFVMLYPQFIAPLGDKLEIPQSIVDNTAERAKVVQLFDFLKRLYAVRTGDSCNEELVPLFAEQDGDVYFKDALTTMNNSTISDEQFWERLKVDLDKIYEDIDKYSDSLAEVASDNPLFSMIEQNNMLFGAGLMSLLSVSAALNDNFNNCIVTNIANSAIVAQGRLGGWKQILWMHEDKFVFLGTDDMLYTHVDGVNSQPLPLVDGVPQEALKSFRTKPSEIKCVGNTLIAVTTPNTSGPFRSMVMKFNLVPLKERGNPVSEDLYTFYQNESTVSMDCSEKLLSIHSTINTSKTLHTIFLSSPKNTIASTDLLSFLQSNLELHKLTLSQDNDISKGDVYVFDTVAIVVFKLCKGDLASSSADWHLALKPLPGQPPTLLSVIKDIPKKDYSIRDGSDLAVIPSTFPSALI